MPFWPFWPFCEKNWTGKLFILRSSYVQQSMLTKLKLVVWRKTLIRRLSEKHLGSCFQDMSKVNFILRHRGKKTFLTHSWISRVRRLKWSGKGRAVIGNRFSDGSCQRDIWSKCEGSSTSDNHSPTTNYLDWLQQEKSGQRSCCYYRARAFEFAFSAKLKRDLRKFNLDVSIYMIYYIWVILRCWGNSSILCQQNSDAL